MSDIFFSYSSKDRDRVRPIHAALAERGFEIFWDQSVPPGTDWDTWIRQRLNQSKCAIVFWSVHSIVSDNVRHEASVAKQHGKLIPVLLDDLAADQFPMGHYALQGANLSAWTGDEQYDGWLKLQQEVEAKLTPLWVRRQIDRLEAELVAERARREGAERRDRTLREQIVKEVASQQQVTRERDDLLEAVSMLKDRLGTAEEDNSKLKGQIDEDLRRRDEIEDRQDHLLRQAAEAAQKIETLERTISELKVATAKREIVDITDNQSTERGPEAVPHVQPNNDMAKSELEPIAKPDETHVTDLPPPLGGGKSSAHTGPEISKPNILEVTFGAILLLLLFGFLLAAAVSQ